MSQTYDLIIRGGLVVDGTGAAPQRADVAVRDGLIAAIGQIAGGAEEEIDGTGCIVTPGFVDIHTHYDGQVTWEDTLAPSSGHGVTTVVMGNCGVGFAPLRPEQHEMAIKLMEGVEDIPGVVMSTGVPFNWESFPQYLDALEARHADIDFAAQLPHSPLRVYVMGERGAELEPPFEGDLAAMRKLTAEAIRAGAVGVSTSRTYSHRFKDGRLAPSVSTEDEEVLALADGLADAGTGVFQLVPDTFASPEDQLSLLRRIAERSGRPVSFTFMQTAGKPDQWRTILDGLEEAKRDGLEIRGQVIPRPTGGLLGLELSFHPFSLNPSFRALEPLSLAEKVREMRKPEVRRQLLSESPADPNPFFTYVVSEHDQLFVLGEPPNYNPDVSESIGLRARAAGIDPRELIYDTLLERDGHEVLYRPMGNYEGERFESVGRNMLHTDRTVIALGDGGAHYSMICDAAYTTYFLLYWMRDAEADKRVELPDAIRMLTRDPAEAVGFLDRGVVAVGYKADLNVIDIDSLHLYAPRPAWDLPAGGRRLRQRADGYRATVVSGVVTYREGEATGALPGRLVRGAQEGPEEDA